MIGLINARLMHDSIFPLLHLFTYQMKFGLLSWIDLN